MPEPTLQEEVLSVATNTAVKVFVVTYTIGLTIRADEPS